LGVAVQVLAIGAFKRNPSEPDHMTDYYLRTDTEAQMVEAFASIGVEVKRIDGERNSLDGQRIDIGWIGPVTRIVNGEAVTDARFHVNLRVAGELTEEQVAELPILNPPPSNPMRVWA
jgi:hypothetical protein